jgi:transcriptional regulator with XRE-family HTH domain
MKPETLRAFRGIARGKKLSQSELADLASKALQANTGDPERSISESLIALIETGRRQPSVENAQAIADALGVELEALATIAPDDSAVAS